MAPDRPSLASIVGIDGDGASSSPFDRLLDLCAIVPSELKGNGWERVLSSVERLCLQAALEKSKNQKEAAEALGLTQTKLHRLIRKHGLKQDRGQSAEADLA